MFCFSFNPRCNPSLEWCVTHSKISLLSHPLRRFFCGVLPVFWDKAADDRGPLWDFVFSQVPCIIWPVVDYLIALFGLVWKHSYCRKWSGCIIVESKSLELSFFFYSLVHAGFICLSKNTVKTVTLWMNYYYNSINWCKAEFSASLLQSSVSHDLSEIILIFWFAAQEKLLIITNVENVFIFQNFFMNGKFKRTAFI